MRDAAVSAIDTIAKIKNCATRLSTPSKPANAAASAPMPNHSNTKPVEKISATIRIAPRIVQKIQM